MFIIILLILLVDTIMLGYFACDCGDWQREILVYLIPMYLLQIIGYAALYRIYLKMKSGKREKLQDVVKKLREENEELKSAIQQKNVEDKNTEE
ncbi:hypothetical protein DRQ29_03710 [bacterium]|nr:MAG: hypothetical protein DRQ29_03710 [bacterium]